MIETQIVLAIVGALIMLVVGASLARAFGIAGAANLIRYRAKIEDPKDAVVMLSALSVGLASGVGLFGIAAVGINPRDDGTQLNLIGIQTSTLDEAKYLSARAMKNENPKHTCSPACGVWQEF